MTGYTHSTNFPTTPGAFDTTFNGFRDAFVTKLTADGAALVYSTYLGGSSIAFGRDIAVDASGSAYVTGQTFSPDFPATPGAFDTTPNGGYDAFVTKLTADGSALVYSTYLGGSSAYPGGGADDNGQGIAVDASGSAYVTGDTGSANFPTTPGAVQTTFNGNVRFGSDAFVTKLNAGGYALVYSTYLGGNRLRLWRRHRGGRHGERLRDGADDLAGFAHHA